MLARIVAAFLVLVSLGLAMVSCTTGPDPVDMVPTTGLPEGVDFAETAAATPRGGYPKHLVENVSSMAHALYHCGATEDAYMLILECHDDEAAKTMLDDLVRTVLDEEVFDTASVEFNGHSAIEGWTDVSPEYVYIWANESFVFVVTGTSRESTLALAEATQY